MLPRPCHHLSAIKTRYPDIWKHYDLFLAGRGNELPAWRPTQGIYRFDPDIARAIKATDLDSGIPSDLPLRLPEWCVYIECPEPEMVLGHKIAGFFSHPEWDVNTRRTELRLVLDAVAPMERLFGVPLHIDGAVTLIEALSKAYAECVRIHTPESGADPGIQRMLRDRAETDSKGLAPLVGLILYLCSKNAEVRNSRIGMGSENLKRPAPTRTKKGPRYFPPDRRSASGWERRYGPGREGKIQVLTRVHDLIFGACIGTRSGRDRYRSRRRERHARSGFRRFR